jgi:carbon storage regulator
MLVLTIKEGERVEVGDDVVVRMMRDKLGKVRLAFEAPRHVRIMRGKVLDREKGGVADEHTPPWPVSTSATTLPSHER